MFTFDTSQEIANIVIFSLYLPTWFMIYKYIRPSFIYMMNNTDKSWLIFSMIPLSYSVYIYSMGMYSVDGVINLFNIKNAVLLSILVLSAYYLILQFFKQTKERLTMETEQNLLITQVYSVNLILSSYIAKAKSEQITVKTQIDIPEKNAVSDMDLCVIFANAIENAINACKEISNSNEKFIKISSRIANNKLYIQITNSFDGTIIFVNDMPIRAEKNHGLGTKSIAAVAQKYGGVYSFTTEDGVFKTSIIL